MNSRDMFWSGLVVTVVLYSAGDHTPFVHHEHIHAETLEVEPVNRSAMFVTGSISGSNIARS